MRLLPLLMKGRGLEIGRQGRPYNINLSKAPSALVKVTNVPAPHCGLIKVLSLDRPSSRNAISRQLLAELSHQIDGVRNEGERGPTRALVLASAVDACFSAGADLKVCARSE